MVRSGVKSDGFVFCFYHGLVLILDHCAATLPSLCVVTTFGFSEIISPNMAGLVRCEIEFLGEWILVQATG